MKQTTANYLFNTILKVILIEYQLNASKDTLITVARIERGKNCGHSSDLPLCRLNGSVDYGVAGTVRNETKPFMIITPLWRLRPFDGYIKNTAA